MLINTPNDLEAAYDTYRGKRIVLIKPNHTSWSDLLLKAVETDSQPTSHIPIIMQIYTDRGIYRLNPPFEITEEVANDQQPYDHCNPNWDHWVEAIRADFNRLGVVEFMRRLNNPAETDR